MKLWDLTSKEKLVQGIYFLNSLWLWGCSSVDNQKQVVKLRKDPKKG